MRRSSGDGRWSWVNPPCCAPEIDHAHGARLYHSHRGNKPGSVGGSRVDKEEAVDNVLRHEHNRRVLDGARVRARLPGDLSAPSERTHLVSQGGLNMTRRVWQLRTGRPHLCRTGDGGRNRYLCRGYQVTAVTESSSGEAGKPDTHSRCLKEEHWPIPTRSLIIML